MFQSPLNVPQELNFMEARFPPGQLLMEATAQGGIPDGEFWFHHPHEVLVAWAPEQVLPLLEAVQAHVDAGFYAVGFLAYEAAVAFDPANAVHELPPGLPYAVWGIFSSPDFFGREGAHPRPLQLQDWRSLISPAEYKHAISRIKGYLAAGHTYQVNFAFPMETTLEESPHQLFRVLLNNQPCDTAAYLEFGPFAVVSATPELFFELNGDLSRTRPMKGTMPRKLWSQADEEARQALSSCSKQRAENLMIVDLLRNDMGRISETGSVKVTSLFEVEQYPTVWQMTSTICSRTSRSLREIFSALFPCGSVTGAPKIRTMQIIRELEPWPRWVYCGAIGWVAPGRKARFSVPIRTLLIDKQESLARYYVGSGITIDSDADLEYEECLTKARVLSTPPLPAFELLETLRFANDHFEHLSEHLARLAASARYFHFQWHPDAIEEALEEFAREHADTERPLKVRLLYARNGDVRVEASELNELAYPLSLVFAESPVDKGDVLLYHKTTHRRVYEEALAKARARFPHADDVVLFNREGYVTESTFANIIAELDGTLCTPPVECGLLQGVFRQILLEKGQIVERPMTLAEIRHAKRLYLINSVRGWMPAQLMQL